METGINCREQTMQAIAEKVFFLAASLALAFAALISAEMALRLRYSYPQSREQKVEYSGRLGLNCAKQFLHVHC
jgi:hypothetical protein